MAFIFDGPVATIGDKYAFGVCLFSSTACDTIRNFTGVFEGFQTFWIQAKRTKYFTILAFYEQILRTWDSRSFAVQFLSNHKKLSTSENDKISKSKPFHSHGRPW